MYAIVEIAGKQFRVKEKGRLRVPLLPVESGKKVEFENVLVLNDDKGKLTIGTPTVSKVKVSATVIEHSREKKIVVFKKKRRKGYQVKNGHRQHYSLIMVDKIGAGSAKSETSAKTEEPAAAKVKETPVAAPKADAKPEVKAKTAAKPKTEVKTTAKAKTAAKPKTEAKPKAAAKPKAKAKDDKKEE